MPTQRNPDGRTLPVIVRVASVDCWSDVRHLHALCIRRMAETSIEPSDADAFFNLIQSPDYTDVLMTHDLQTAWYDDHLVGTAGWVPSDDAGTSARITAVFVSPQFARLGVGRRLVALAEARARAAGFRTFATRAFQPSVAFFEALGYQRSSQGVHALGTDNGIPITFMRRIDAAARKDAPGGRATGSQDGEPPRALVSGGQS